MPIKFACEHCGQRLNVSSKQAGLRAKCPKCQGKIQVPAATDEAPHASDETPQEGGEPTENSGPPNDQAEVENPYAEFVVYDDEVEWHYESDDDDVAAPRLADATDLHRVAVPRAVLYAQGVLLIVVAAVSFVLGMLVTGGGAQAVVDAGPVPCVLTGQVVYVTGGGRSLPDDGAVVLVLPTDRRPAPTGKAPVDGLRPGDPLPRNDSDNLRIIQSIGGAYARTDIEGRYQLTLPDAGQYFVLVVSKNKSRPAGEQLSKTDLAQLGSYVLPPTELLGESEYTWREVTVRKSDSIDVTF